jgi:putative transport protein
MSTLLILFLILGAGYLLGRISIKGLSLGSSGVLIVALVCGHFGYSLPSEIKNIGLAMFVCAVGFIAGPTFFRNFKKQALNYILLGVIIILIGAGLCLGALKIFKIPTPLAVGLMSGALTSTPGLAAAIEASGSDLASVGYGIAYPFGVVGVVLFVQLMPRILRVNVAEEAEKLNAQLAQAQSQSTGSTRLAIDENGICCLSVAIVLGILIGKISIPLPGGAKFSLGTSGGPLLSGLILGHFGHIGKIDISVPSKTLKVLRELGLIFFLAGAGIGAGKGFIAVLQEYGIFLFLIGIVLTSLPMIIGYFIASKLMHISILESLGSITGGMTSTPALGALISMSGTDAVAASYAATYPSALLFVVLSCQFIVLLF